MIDASTGEPVVMTARAPMPQAPSQEPVRVSPLRVLAYILMVAAGLLLGAIVGLIGLIFFGGVMLC